MTFESAPPREALVWTWLPGRTEPMVAGRIQAEGARFIVNYGRTYLSRQDAIAIHLPELPLKPGALEPEPPLAMANALRDASPDVWHEFSRDPRTPEQLATVRALFAEDGVIPFSELLAATAAEVFRRLGSPRRRAEVSE